jgi:hypothetical protein
MKQYAIYFTNMVCACILLAVSFLFSSCKNVLQVDFPGDRVSAENLFTTDELATSSVMGLYSRMMITGPTIYSNGAASIYGSLSADELYPTALTEADLQFYNNDINPSSSEAWDYFWNWAYKHIYQANACLEGLSSASSISSSVKNQLTGEVKFIRAFAYFNLVNFFGDVPLVLSTDYRHNSQLPRTSAAQVWQQITSDLSEAIPLLSEAYPTAERVRVNKWAATALLARVYLYTQQWDKAETLSTQVINAPGYSLVADLNQVFLPNSTEAIWQLMPTAAGFTTLVARRFVPLATATAKPTFAITPHLYNAFEPGDARRTAWTGQKTVGSETFYYPFKYKVRGATPPTEYENILRLAEQYLIRAEARAMKGNLDGAVADLNKIRERASLPPLSLNDPQAIRLAIEQERRIELFTEHGHRWFDLKRTGRADAVLSPIKPGWQPTDVFYPVYEQELLRNRNLTQTPGY